MMAAALLVLLHGVVTAAAQSPPVGPALALPSIFHSSMVLQHSQPTAFWGVAWPGQKISVTLSGSATLTTTAAAADGRFAVTLPAQPPSLTPHTLTVTAEAHKLTLNDVVFGSVFVCSGQSNMGLQVAATINATEEIAAAGSHGTGLRLMQVATADAYWNVTTPQDNLTTSVPWGRASPANAGGFSALCYYFGVEQVRRYPAMPVGMIASAWGGTAIETWMTRSENGLVVHFSY
jgi:sialate O-acetylesterase